MKKLIIIPAYNEEASIRNTVQKIIQSSTSFDYIIINDGSSDNTRRICEENGFNIVNLPFNLGIGGAVQTGYKFAYENGYDYAIQIDADGQHDIIFLEKMVEYMETEDADMVIGSRFLEKNGFQSSFVRRIGIRFFTFLIRILTGVTITDPTSGMRLARKNVIQLFAEDYPKDYPEPETAVTIIRKGLKISEMPVVMRERQGGQSSISLNKSIYYMIKVPVAMIIERFS